MTASPVRESLLFLAHRIPFPPDKGDKIRSFHMLDALCTQYRVRLGCFVDDPLDMQYLPALEAQVEQLCAIPINARARKVLSLTALFGNGSMSAQFYRHPKMQAFVDEALRDTDRMLVFSSPMTQYLPAAPRSPGRASASAPIADSTEAALVPSRCLADFVDVDSVKWAQYAERKWPPMSWLYRLESARLARDEARWSKLAGQVSFVSDAEASLFRERLKAHRPGRLPTGTGASLTGKRASPIGAGVSSVGKVEPSSVPEIPDVLSIPNGVAAERFDPDLDYPNPFPGEGPRVVFVGAMDYWANVDAVTTFVEQVWPQVLAEVPEAKFFVVGRHPTPAVRRLASPTIQVTGGVDDVRQWVAHADVVVAPLRIARGVQNKVLEAMAMARPLVATPEALEGIPLDAHLRVSMLASTPAEEAARVVGWLRRPRPVACPEYRDFVVQKMSWSASMRRLIECIENPAQQRLVGAVGGRAASAHNPHPAGEQTKEDWAKEEPAREDRSCEELANTDPGKGEWTR